MNHDRFADGEIQLLIAGLGNCLLMDDGIGVHAVRALQREPVQGAEVVEVGTAVLDALHLIERARILLALDAVQAGEAPGTIYELHFDSGARAGTAPSLHEVGLREALAMLPEDRQPELIVLGVEPASIDYGLNLSTPLRDVLPEFVATVRRVAADLISKENDHRS